MPDILSCLRVSRHWQRLANDNLIWRGFFYRSGFGIDANAARQLASTLQVPPPSPLTPMTPSTPSSPISSLTKFAYYIPAYHASMRSSVSSFNTYNSLESTLQIIRAEPSALLAPLSLDWKDLYKKRCEIEEKVAVAEPQRFSISAHSDAIYCVEYDGENMITGSRDKSIRVWTIRPQKVKLRMTLLGHEGSVLCLQFDHTGFMVSGSSDRSIIAWNLMAEPGYQMLEVMREHKGGVLDLKMDSKWIISWQVALILVILIPNL
jgi:F-box and WD-40 domain protein 1/11